MSQPDIARQHRGRLYTLSCVLLCGLVALSGWAWRAASRERRGIEPAQGDRVLAQGINVELAQYGPAERARALDDVESLGVQWVRQRFPWREVEPEGGRYDWARWDAVVEATSRRGLKLIAVLDGPPDWALRHAPVPLPCAPPWRVEAYARYVGAFARRYGEAIEAYQVWDEPNLSQAQDRARDDPMEIEAKYTVEADAFDRLSRVSSIATFVLLGGQRVSVVDTYLDAGTTAGGVAAL
ncbi:MAG: beta-galactosidase, partial [Anaerolineae bacterium]